VTTCTVHPHAEAAQACARCERPFCDRCLVEILGGLVCEECKASALKGVISTPGVHSLAVVSLVVPVVGYLACVPIPLTSSIGLVLSLKALRDISQHSHYSGRTLALIGLVISASTLATFLIALIATLLFRALG
jgi:hypothetical protein